MCQLCVEGCSIQNIIEEILLDEDVVIGKISKFPLWYIHISLLGRASVVRSRKIFKIRWNCWYQNYRQL